MPGMKEGKRGSYRDYAVAEIEPPVNAAAETVDLLRQGLGG